MISVANVHLDKIYFASAIFRDEFKLVTDYS
jgi:hypothetical protein